MPGFDGTGPMGMGPMTGGRRGFCSPWGMGGGRWWYGRPRWASYGYPYYSPSVFSPFTPRMTREREVEFLKNEAQAMRDELKELETRMGQLSTDKK